MCDPFNADCRLPCVRPVLAQHPLQETQETPRQNRTLYPKWVDTKLDWFKVRCLMAAKQSRPTRGLRQRRRGCRQGDATPSTSHLVVDASVHACSSAAHIHPAFSDNSARPHPCTIKQVPSGETLHVRVWDHDVLR